MEVHYNNSCQEFSANIQPMRLLVIHFWLAHRLFSLYLSICVETYMHNTRAHFCTQVNEHGYLDGYYSTSLRWTYLGVLSDTPTECFTQCANVPSLK